MFWLDGFICINCKNLKALKNDCTKKKKKIK